MRKRSATIFGVLAVAAVAASPALAFRGGSSGGDREPAGGAFMSSFRDNPQQAYGPPRSVDIPRNGYYHQGERYVPYGHGHPPRYRTW